MAKPADDDAGQAKRLLIFAGQNIILLVLAAATIRKILIIGLLLASADAAGAQEYLPELVRRIKPSAVALETFDSKGNSLSRGSGFFIAPDRIITNRHVIEKATRVEIHLLDGSRFTAKGVLALDGEGDLAILQVDVPARYAQPLPVVRTVPQEGESVVVIGNPFGLEGSVSNGIVSAVRDISGYGRIIQITAPISPGSSGSPVVNMAGQVIGVATLQAAEGQSLNFAVPAERIAQMRIGELQTFAAINSESLKTKRSAAERLYSQGVAQMSLDDYGRAAVYFEKALEQDPNYPEALYQLGFCYGVLGRHAEALKVSKQAARLRPEWPETYANIGASNFALGQYREAADSYRQALKLDENNADFQYAYGLALNKLNRTDEEILAYRRAIAAKPDHLNALERLGQALAKQKRWAEAVNVFETLNAYRPDAKSLNALGEARLELGSIEESIEAFNNALAFDPNLDKARYNLGRAYIKAGNTQLAAVQYEILRNAKSEWADRLLILINR